MQSMSEDGQKKWVEGKAQSKLDTNQETVDAETQLISDSRRYYEL